MLLSFAPKLYYENLACTEILHKQIQTRSREDNVYLGTQYVQHNYTLYIFSFNVG